MVQSPAEKPRPLCPPLGQPLSCTPGLLEPHSCPVSCRVEEVNWAAWEQTLPTVCEEPSGRGGPGECVSVCLAHSAVWAPGSIPGGALSHQVGCLPVSPPFPRHHVGNWLLVHPPLLPLPVQVSVCPSAAPSAHSVGSGGTQQGNKLGSTQCPLAPPQQASLASPTPEKPLPLPLPHGPGLFKAPL